MTGKSGNGNGAAPARAGFEIFRGKDAPLLGRRGACRCRRSRRKLEPDFARTVEAGLGRWRARAAGLQPARLQHSPCLVQEELPAAAAQPRRGLSIYYITAGSLRIGDQTLGKGDGFFLPKDMPYTYRAGPDGVELLEFRQTDRVSISASTPTRPPSGQKAAEICAANQEDWKVAPPPGG